jgi:pimeloyl-ACP methyl ester carboxylesterase
MVDRFVDGEGDTSIAVRDFGGDGEPILFVHGFGHDQNVWDDVVGDLGIPARVLTMDLRGHGRSGWSIEGDYGLEAYAADLARVVDGLGLERVGLVAHSMGGNVATLFAAGAPERVSRFVLVDTGPSLSSAGMMQAAQGVAGTLRS